MTQRSKKARRARRRRAAFGRARDLAMRVVGLASLGVVLAAAVWFVRVTTIDTASGSTTQRFDVADQAAVGAADAAAQQQAAVPAQQSQAGAGGGQEQSKPYAVARVSASWLDNVSQATGIPARALAAYASAQLTVDAEQPACGLGWNTIAGIGWIESGHGTHGGGRVDDAGYPTAAIVGPQLNGDGNARIPDSDDGAIDGDAGYDRAVGPMQFIPTTWAKWGADGNGDGASDPNQIDDAALATARYLCHSGSVKAPEAWRAAVFSYNHLDEYVNSVAAAANRYASAAA